MKISEKRENFHISPKLAWSIGAILVCFFVSGCMMKMPEMFSSKVLEQATPDSWSVPKKITSNPYEIERHSERLLSLTKDKNLTAFVTVALEKNPNLLVVAARIRDAQLLSGLSTSKLFPTLTFGTSVSRTKIKNSEENSASINNGFTPNLTFAWILDVWGRLADQRDASLQDIIVRQEELDAARASLTAQIMSDWITLAGQKAVIKLEQARIESLKLAEESIKGRYSSGIGSLSDLDAAKAETALAQANLQSQLNAFNTVRQNLKILAGEFPSKVVEPGNSLPDILLPGSDMPLNVINRRPDIQAARISIAAADLRTNAAYKNLLPNLNLSAVLNDSVTSLPDLLKGGPAWSLLSEITSPIWDASRRKNQVRLAENQANKAWLNYKRTVLAAAAEVENTLSNERFYKFQEATLSDNSKYSQTNYETFLRNYLDGQTDIVTLLITKRSAFNAKIRLIEMRSDRMKNRVSLGLALGFGQPIAEI